MKAWKTLYVSGRAGFDQEVKCSMKKMGADFITGSFNEDGTYLFWVTDGFGVRKLKKVIGSKVIFKYRLRFFSTVDLFLESGGLDRRKMFFTPDQEQVFRDFDESGLPHR